MTTVDLLTAVSVNGIITLGRGLASTDLLGRMTVPPGVLALKGEIRRRYGAVLIGTETVLVNDPTLTSHRIAGEERFACVRATLDPAGRIPPGAHFLDGSARTLVGITEKTPRSYLDLLAARGVEAVPAAAGRGGVEGPQADLPVFLAGLAARGIASVVCEGGGLLNRALLAAGLVDRLHLLLLPAVLAAGSVNLFAGGRDNELTELRLEAAEPIDDFLYLRYRVKGDVRGTAPRPDGGRA
jgi:diaminohydroxyphosphoribosylaminopyrimidine deaminase/5-amino-6-(5-phosphoribosylamino)uracil reductase